MTRKREWTGVMLHHDDLLWNVAEGRLPALSNQLLIGCKWVKKFGAKCLLKMCRRREFQSVDGFQFLSNSVQANWQLWQY